MIDQIGIAMLGCTAIWLSQDEREERRRLACLFGMAAQPFWYYAAWSAQQWGILLVCVPYTAAWAKGVFVNWIKPRPRPQTQAGQNGKSTSSSTALCLDALTRSRQ